MAEVHERELSALMQEFPEVSCFCELCDCGRHRHHANCTKNRLASNARSHTFPETDYQSTFRRQQQRPRSNKRPPPTPRDPNPPRMVFDPSTKRDFPNLGDYHQRPAAFSIEEKYVAPVVPVESKTWYTSEFVPKEMTGVPMQATKPGQVYNMNRNSTFHGHTTNKDHYKAWVRDRSVPFSELPSFTGSILYPERNHPSETTNQRVFKGAFTKRPEAYDPVEGNITYEGQHDFMTTNMNTYTPKRSDRPAAFDPKPQMQKFYKNTFQGETQTMADFRQKDWRARAQPAAPAPETIDIKFDNKTSFSTEQREQYQGIDTAVHKVKHLGRDEGEYRKPAVAMETQTNQKLDYLPKDLSKAMAPRAKAPVTRRSGPKPNFDGTTSNKVQFRDPGMKQGRLRHGDFHEAQKYGFVRPVKPFNAETTTASTFKSPKPQAIPKPFIPSESSIARDGKQDFGTVYSQEFKGRKPQLCRAQAYLLKQELLRRRQARQTGAPVAQAQG